MQFIVVIIGTVVSYFLDLKTSHSIRVIGDVPTGLPQPELPDLTLLPKLISDAFTLTIIGFVVSLSIARIMASKHNYTVKPNQELVAMGASNLFGCFFRYEAPVQPPRIVNKQLSFFNKIITKYNSHILN